MKKKYEILLTSLLLLLLLFLSAPAVNSLNLKPYVNDYYGVLDTEYISKINGVCEELEQSTGAEMVVLVNNFSENIDEYSINIFDENKIGKKGIDNGILIVVNPETNDWIILVGYGLEGVLNDAKLADIGRTYLEPYIDSGDYGEGIYYTTGILGTTIYDSGEFQKKNNFFKDKWPILAAIIILLLVFIITRGKIFFLPGIEKDFGGGRTGGGRGKR